VATVKKYSAYSTKFEPAVDKRKAALGKGGSEFSYGLQLRLMVALSY